jgi:hypothetical protein
MVRVQIVLLLLLLLLLLIVHKCDPVLAGRLLHTNRVAAKQ